MCPGLVGAVDGYLTEIQNLDIKEFDEMGIPKSKFMCYKGFYGNII